MIIPSVIEHVIDEGNGGMQMREVERVQSLDEEYTTRCTCTVDSCEAAFEAWCCQYDVAKELLVEKSGQRCTWTEARLAESFTDYSPDVDDAAESVTQTLNLNEEMNLETLDQALCSDANTVVETINDFMRYCKKADQYDGLKDGLKVEKYCGADSTVNATKIANFTQLRTDATRWIEDWAMFACYYSTWKRHKANLWRQRGGEIAQATDSLDEAWKKLIEKKEVHETSKKAYEASKKASGYDDEFPTSVQEMTEI